ncbi:MAG TPA: hypothetical protein VHB21_22975, partial [Minicystis sp.]|nr:hypothetical protein [Minicystis sp.]
VALIFGALPIFMGIGAQLMGIERMGHRFWLAAAISLTGVGLVAAVIGFALIGEANQGVLQQCGSTTCDPQQQRVNGALLAVGGGIGVAVGVPLLVVGARRVTLTPAAPGAALGLGVRATF